MNQQVYPIWIAWRSKVSEIRFELITSWSTLEGTVVVGSLTFQSGQANTSGRGTIVQPPLLKPPEKVVFYCGCINLGLCDNPREQVQTQVRR